MKRNVPVTPEELYAVVACDVPGCDRTGPAHALYCDGCQSYVCARHPAPLSRSHRREAHGRATGDSQ